MMQAAQQGSEGKRPFFPNLNVFVAASAVLGYLAGLAILLPLSLLLKLVLPAPEAQVAAWPLVYVLVAAGLGWLWWKHGLSPPQLNPALARNFKIGHVLLAFSNIAVVTNFVGVRTGYALLPDLPVLRVGIAYYLVYFVPMVVFAGILLVCSARGKAPAYARTLPAASPPPVAPRQMPSAELPPEPTRAERAPSLLGVLAGLMVSSYVLFMAGVYGAIAFPINHQALYGIVLPLAGAVYVLYVATALWLFTRRSSAANWVVWAPAALLLAASTVGQSLFHLIELIAR